MPDTPAGWYRDPSGPFQRYWDGVQWTEHTQPHPAGGYTQGNSTRPLPSVRPRDDRPWWKRKRFFIPGGVLAAFIILIVLVAIFAPPPTPSHQAAEEQTVATTPTASSPSARTSASESHTAPKTTSAPPTRHSPSAKPKPTRTKKKPRSTSAAAPPDDGSFTMPNEVGQVLQDAQDDIQRVSGDPVFVSHSHDLRGTRFQILDSDWKVCTQNINAGTDVSAIGHIDFGVVKTDESCP